MNTSLIMLTCIRLMISSVYLPPISGYRENDRWNAWGYLNEQIRLRAREQHYTHSAAQPVNMKTIKQLISKGKKSPCSTQLAKARQNLGALDTVKARNHHDSSQVIFAGKLWPQQVQGLHQGAATNSQICFGSIVPWWIGDSRRVSDLFALSYCYCCCYWMILYVRQQWTKKVVRIETRIQCIYPILYM